MLWAVSGAQPLFTLELLMFTLSLVDFLSLLLSPSTYLNIFLFLSKVSFEVHIQNLQKNFMLVENLNEVFRTNID